MRARLGVLVLTMLPCAAAAGEDPKPPDPERHVRELEAADRHAEAEAAARELIDQCARSHGPEHWRTTWTEQCLETLDR